MPSHKYSLSQQQGWPRGTVMNDEMQAKFPKESFFSQVERITVRKPFISLAPSLFASNVVMRPIIL